MTNQLDLLTVVRNMLADVREKTVQLADAQLALETSRARLIDSQKDLGNHIKTLNELSTEINSELSSISLAEDVEAAVADSLKTTEASVDETLAEVAEPAKTAASDESPVSEVELTITGSKGGPGRKLTEKLALVPEEEIEPAVDDEDSESAVEPEPKAETPKVSSASKKAAAPEKKVNAPVVGLWDDDDDEVF